MLEANYFDLFGLPVSFRPDAQALKKSYYKLSRQYHPDFHTDAGAEEQDRVASMAEHINTGFQTLSDQASCMKYILEMKGLLSDVGAQSLPQNFLFDMMELNEEIDSLQPEMTGDQVERIRSKVSLFDNALEENLDHWINQFESGQNREEALQEIKILYLKSKYLLRIRENISTFAAP